MTIEEQIAKHKATIDWLRGEAEWNENSKFSNTPRPDKADPALKTEYDRIIAMHEGMIKRLEDRGGGE